MVVRHIRGQKIIFEYKKGVKVLRNLPVGSVDRRWLGGASSSSALGSAATPVSVPPLKCISAAKFFPH